MENNPINPIEDIKSLYTIGKYIIYFFAFLFVLNLVSMIGGIFSYANPMGWFVMSREEAIEALEECEKRNSDLISANTVLKAQLEIRKEHTWSETFSFSDEDYKSRQAKIDSLIQGYVIHADGVYVVCK